MDTPFLAPENLPTKLLASIITSYHIIFIHSYPKAFLSPIGGINSVCHVSETQYCFCSYKYNYVATT